MKNIIVSVKHLVDTFDNKSTELSDKIDFIKFVEVNGNWALVERHTLVEQLNQERFRLEMELNYIRHSNKQNLVSITNHIENAHMFKFSELENSADITIIQYGIDNKINTITLKNVEHLKNNQQLMLSYGFTNDTEFRCIQEMKHSFSRICNAIYTPNFTHQEQRNILTEITDIVSIKEREDAFCIINDMLLLPLEIN